MSTHVCVVCGATEAEFTCGFCRIPRYCARLCQKKDHQRHKQECSDKVMERRRKKEEEEETKLSKELKKVSVEDQKQYTEMLCTGVKEENLRLIQLLLAKDETNVNEVGTEGLLPLWMACSNGHASVVELLLAASDIDVNQAKTTTGSTPLFMACQNGHATIIELLLSVSDIDVNQARTDIGATPLLIACQKGHTPIVKLLLASSEIAVNQAETTTGVTPLFMASQNGHAPVVELLLATSNIHVNKPMMNGATPLIIASYLGHASCVSLLLTDLTINPTLLFQERTALQLAQPSMRVVGWKFLEDKIKIEGRQNVVQLLVDAGRNKQPAATATAAVVAAAASAELATVSVKKSAKEEEEEEEETEIEEEAVMANSPLDDIYSDDVRIHIQFGVRGKVYNLIGSNHFTFEAAIRACREIYKLQGSNQSNSSIVAGLIQGKESDVLLSDAIGSLIPLPWGEKKEKPTVYIIVSKRKKSLRMRIDYSSSDPAEPGDDDYVKPAVDTQTTGESKKSKNKTIPKKKTKKQTPGGETKSSAEPKKVSVKEQRKYTKTLCKAIREEDLTQIRRLLTKDQMNVNDGGKQGMNPLFLACSLGHKTIVELLLRAADINVNQERTDEDDGFTPLLVACEEGHAPIVELLLASSDIAVNQASTDIGCTPLYVACEIGHAPVVELLLAASDIEVNQARTTNGTTNGCTPLSIACHRGHTPVVELLLASSDIDVNQAMTVDGCTPLFIACKNGLYPVVQLLLASSDIDVNRALTTNGVTSLFIACQEGHTPIVRHLLSVSGIDLNKGQQDRTPLRVSQKSEIVQLLVDAGAQ